MTKCPAECATANPPTKNKIQTTPRHQNKYHHIAPPNAPNKNMYTYTHKHTHKTLLFPFFTNQAGTQNTTAPAYAMPVLSTEHPTAVKIAHVLSHLFSCEHRKRHHGPRFWHKSFKKTKKILCAGIICFFFFVRWRFLVPTSTFFLNGEAHLKTSYPNKWVK